MDKTANSSDQTSIPRSGIKQLFRSPQRLSQPAVRTVVDLKPHEIRTYFALVDHPQSSVDELADVLNRPRSHVATVLRTLIDTGLVTRIRQGSETEQQGYVYDTVPLADTKRALHRHVDQWTASVRAEIDALDEPLMEAQSNDESK